MSQAIAPGLGCSSKEHPPVKLPNMETLGDRLHPHLESAVPTQPLCGQPHPVLRLSSGHAQVHTHPCICDLELTQDVLGHVVLSHRVNDKVLVASRTLCRPVLVALLLWTESPSPQSGEEEGEGSCRIQETRPGHLGCWLGRSEAMLMKLGCRRTA